MSAIRDYLRKLVSDDPWEAFGARVTLLAVVAGYLVVLIFVLAALGAL